ncbi:chemoreceptor glutamine deamidase CheD [Marinospirillum alkaliphilum]|uniref:Probable chemoreceptor glutamine deamidase CheD n=1 Tax=Marinospirillum alkaliphilum DSM 21637 TaxID=1122209 RepID=A0A1K1UDT5_9GAMM|nr:chemoreceptor glutamine deamidase CheD [Marinospirillum alkaliphilum]SFX10563.1 chemotaxis protein CheD [Marinospirillum alkaliphilum DSM 21637]
MDFEVDKHFSLSHYYDRHFDTQAVKVLPGEYYATDGEEMICTVLGSCVSVCLRDNYSGIGGLNHFLLPHDRSGETSLLTESARYGTYAMELLINHLLKLGGQRRRFEAKVFGGGQVIRDFTFANVGERNVSFVMKHLANEGIPVVARDVLKTYPRKVHFFPRTGRVMLKKINSLHNNTLIEREKSYLRQVDHKPETGEIDLF